MLVASAGSLMHAIMAFVIVVASLMFLGVPDNSRVGISSVTAWDAGVSTPAQRAGMLPGDEVLALNGRSITDVAAFIGEIHRATGVPVSLLIRRGDHELTVSATPVDGRTVKVQGIPLADPSGPAVGYLGIGIDTLYSRVGAWKSVTTSGHYIWSLISSAVASLPHMFAPSQFSSLFRDVTDAGAAQQAATSGQRPVSGYGAVRLAVQSAEAGPREFIQIFATLNIFIGVLNLIPMMPLDGGLIAVATYERIRTRKGQPRYQADLTKMTPFVYAFLALLAVLFFSTLYLDIVHPIANPFQ